MACCDIVSTRNPRLSVMEKDEIDVCNNIIPPHIRLYYSPVGCLNLVNAQGSALFNQKVLLEINWNRLKGKHILAHSVIFLLTLISIHASLYINGDKVVNILLIGCLPTVVTSRRLIHSRMLRERILSIVRAELCESLTKNGLVTFSSETSSTSSAEVLVMLTDLHIRRFIIPVSRVCQHLRE